MANFSVLYDEVDWGLVRGVSRSLYLTLRLLPRAVRSGITLAYLLARASDTIADTARIELPIRLQTLELLWDFAQQKGERWEPGLRWRHSQENPAERQLLEKLPELMERLKTHPDAQEIRKVWGTILEGQIFDLEHGFLVPLRPEQLDRYTFLVAGCVGGFWTQLCFRKISKFTSLSRQRMEELGTLYGKGLQLINILRDRQEDMSRGRIYLKEEDIVVRWKEAVNGMRSGVEYGIAIDRPCLRYATLLPALMGMCTLRLIGPHTGKVKISRMEVCRILILALPCLWRAQFAIFLAKRLSRNLDRHKEAS